MHSIYPFFQQNPRLTAVKYNLFPTRRVSQRPRCRYTNYFNRRLWEGSLYYNAAETSGLFYYVLFFSGNAVFCR